MRAVFALAAVFAACDVWAASPQYNQCVAAISLNPEDALARATAWKAQGGGAAAEHCAALALIALKRHAEAAAVLDNLAHNEPGTARERAVLFGQAGNTWLLAGEARDAENAFTAALALAPADADLLIDRARARALRKAWADAEADLTRAHAFDASNPQILVLRASARSAQGRKAEARADIDAALALNPIFGEALLERGVMKYAAGDREGARADWERVLTAAPGSPAAADAKAYLRSLDAK
ncbi:MAG: tetratricopeptide repeat protein [Alphaproteobacteria bacterium]